ncbi:MAG: transglycosylase SLT domain-containing protein [Sphingomonas sp.]|jgi:hypothetical protein|uniref:transglycosylase SLT domain-containing protein n=1 Tax=Sphingomonas sp. TaxID=28214 RepID=UPI00356A1E15
MTPRALTFEEARVLAAPAATATGVPVWLLLAIARNESEFKPWAQRTEGHLNDASHGLMQMLYATAHANGYTGIIGRWDVVAERGTGLYDPATNLMYGARFLSSLLARANGDIERAVSAYNAGWGNAKKSMATVPTRFCEIWKPTAPATGRVMDRDCARIRIVQPGEWPNQRYVTAVMQYAREFRSRLASGSVEGAPVGGVVPGGSGGESQPTAAPSTDSSAAFVVNSGVVILIAALGVAAWLLKRGGGW